MTNEVSKELLEAAEKYRRDTCNEACKQGFLDNNPSPSIKSAFIAGAKWQAKQLLQGSPMPEDTVLFNKGVAEGRRLEREDMMKDAVEGTVNQNGILELSNGEAIDVCPSLDKCALGLQLGEKVKLIIVKDHDTE